MTIKAHRDGGVGDGGRGNFRAIRTAPLTGRTGDYSAKLCGKCGGIMTYDRWSGWQCKCGRGNAARRT